MIPLRDDQPTNSFPLVTVLLIAANVLVYAAQQVVPGLTEWYSLVPYRLTHPQDLNTYLVQMTPFGDVVHVLSPGAAPTVLRGDEALVPPGLHPAWKTVFTAMFLHANLLHIGGNMLFFWIFGNNVEDALGKVRFVFFYFVCGAAAALMQTAVGPNSLVPSLGASGAIAGVLAAYWRLYPDARVLTLVPVFFYFLVPIRAYWVILVWAVYDILPAFFTNSAGGGVAYFAHFGGFVMGLLLIGLMGGRRLAVRQRRQAGDY